MRIIWVTVRKRAFLPESNFLLHPVTLPYFSLWHWSFLVTFDAFLFLSPAENANFTRAEPQCCSTMSPKYLYNEWLTAGTEQAHRYLLNIHTGTHTHTNTQDTPHYSNSLYNLNKIGQSKRSGNLKGKQKRTHSWPCSPLTWIKWVWNECPRVTEGETVFMQSPSLPAQILKGSGGTKDRPGGHCNLLCDQNPPSLAWVWPGVGRAEWCLPAVRGWDNEK